MLDIPIWQFERVEEADTVHKSFRDTAQGASIQFQIMAMKQTWVSVIYVGCNGSVAQRNQGVFTKATSTCQSLLMKNVPHSSMRHLVALAACTIRSSFT